MKQNIQNINKPIQVISCCNVDGEFTPIKFRIESDDGELITVKIDEVLYKDGRSSIQFNRFMHYTCKGLIYGRLRTFILCYTITTHCWTLLRFLS